MAFSQAVHASMAKEGLINQQSEFLMIQAKFKERYIQVLLETFKRTIEFLEFYQIRWCVAGGTCIGAVRHQGIIPWDDDIDLYVLRDDYDKLFGLRDQLSHYTLEMKSIEDGCGYYNGFIKIFDSNTTLWERKEFEDVVGVYVDVFPLDRSDASVSDLVKASQKYRMCMNRYLDDIRKTSLADYCELAKGIHLKTIKDRLFFSLSRHDTKKDYEDFLHSTRQIPYDPNGKNVMCVLGSYREREHWPADWFGSMVEMPFADFTVKVPSGYDKYLTQLYGDYMQIPQKDKQVSRHSHYYCNLKERLSLDEVKMRVKRGETCIV